MYLKAILCICLVPLLLPGSAKGAWFKDEEFGYYEHRRVSNLALELAREHLILSHNNTFRSITESNVVLDALLKDAPFPKKRTTYGDLVALTDYTTDPLEFFRLLAALDKDPIPVAIDRVHAHMTRINKTLQLLFASHYNADHFQDRLVFSFSFWHQEAIDFAAEGDLFPALVLNAFADHFLQDFFAPGHVLIPRQGLHDLAALGLHDRYNKIGRKIRVRKTAALAPFLESIAQSSSQTLMTTFGSFSADSLLWFERDDLFVHGDYQLSPGSDQEKFMVLVVARSVYDILNAYLTATPANSFPDSEWRNYSLRNSGLISPRANLTYGVYEQAPATQLKFPTLVSLSGGVQSLIGPGTNTSRGYFEIETLLAGVPGTEWIDFPEDTPKWLRKIPQLGIGPGYSLLIAEGYFAHGPGARIVFPLTRINSQLSIASTYRFYIPDQGRRRKRGNVSGKFEIGFGLLFAGISVGLEHGFATDGTFQRYLGVTSYILVASPLARIF